MTKLLKSTVILTAIAAPASAFSITAPTVTYDIINEVALQSDQSSAEVFAITGNMHLGDFQETSRAKTNTLSSADMYAGDGAALMVSVRSIV